MYQTKRKAFTMLELVFVIAVIGILSAIAVPRFAVTRDDAVITKAKTVVSSVRNAMATEKQKRTLKGVFTPISSLHVSGSSYVFDGFDGDSNNPVLDYPPLQCVGSAKGCWKISSGPKYQFVMPVSGVVDFNISNNRFNCDIANASTGRYCKLLTQ